VKRRVAFYFVSFFLFPFLLVADNVTAQTIGYRQTNLAANVSNVCQQRYARFGRYPALFLTQPPSTSQCSSRKERP
jgi:hypothetical protein